MAKVTVIGYRPIMDAAVESLQCAGVLEIEQTPFSELPTAALPPDDARVREGEEHLAQIQFVSEFLGRYHVNEQPFATFVSEKFHISEDRYHDLTFGAHHARLYHECVSLSDRLAHNERERQRLTQLAADLEPWTSLRLQISQWQGTENTVLFTGTVPASESVAIRQQLREQVADVTVEEVGPTGFDEAWVVISHRSCLEAVRSVLAGTPFTEVAFPGLSDYPAEELADARDRIAELDRETEAANQRATELAESEYKTAVTLSLALESRLERAAVRGEMTSTRSAFVITGWIPERLEPELRETLAGFGTDLDLTVEEPGPDDVVPVQLENPWWLKPFEVLTDLYGRPSYDGIDPTILLAPFYLLFFAICVADVGYGAMLIVGPWLIKTRLDVAPGVKRFMDLLMWGGAGAMVVGVLFASYFAIPVENLPPFLASLQVLDPLADLQVFLVVTIIIGLVQVLFGVVIAAWLAFRRGDPAEAVFGQLSTIFLFVMLGITAFAGVTGNSRLSTAALVIGLLGTMLMQGRALQAALGKPDRPLWDRACGWAWLVATIAWTAALALGGSAAFTWAWLAVTAIGLGVSKTARAAVLGLLGGAYSVYGMSSFIGDILSYTRLAALSLSGALVGMVFNILAGLVWDPALGLFSAGGVSWVFGVIVAVLASAVFVFGHIFNVVINLLGAFVHPARLQFVEFFSKFYESGNRVYTPFSFRTENLVLNTGGAGEDEGGA